MSTFRLLRSIVCDSPRPVQWRSGDDTNRTANRDASPANLLVYPLTDSVLVHELSPGECEAILERATIGRVACAQDGQPYIVPVHVVFHERYLYGLATLGQKIDWMRTNSRVCVEVEEITDPRHWTTVLVFGHYEELPSTSTDREARARAEELLARRSVFWLPASAKVPSHEHATPILYRILIIRVTGRRMSRE